MTTNTCEVCAGEGTLRTYEGVPIVRPCPACNGCGRVPVAVPS